jgi:hypothetical protein
MENELNKKQTAVQWFIEQLEEKGVAYENVSFRKIQISIDVSDYLDLKRQAFQMEKEQMINFADNYVDNCVIPNENMAIPTIMDMPNYYSKKYGKPFIDLVSDEESKVHEVVRKLKEKKIQGGNK